jgi:hypothetical protein
MDQLKTYRDELFDMTMPKDLKTTASQRRQEQTVKKTTRKMNPLQTTIKVHLPC